MTVNRYCGRCHRKFPSLTALFDHLEPDTGACLPEKADALPLPQV